MLEDDEVDDKGLVEVPNRVPEIVTWYSEDAPRRMAWRAQFIKDEKLMRFVFFGHADKGKQGVIDRATQWWAQNTKPVKVVAKKGAHWIGTQWMTNRNGHTIRVPADKIEEHLALGYKRGRSTKSNGDRYALHSNNAHGSNDGDQRERVY